MISKQLLLGVGLVVGGGSLLYALSGSDGRTSAQDGDVAHPHVEPLQKEINTEKHLSEQKRKERENSTLAQEKQVKEFFEEQERNKQLAQQKASEPPQAQPEPATHSATVVQTGSVRTVVSDTVSQSRTVVSDQSESLTVQTRPESIVAAQKADELRKKRLAEQKRKQAEKAKLEAKKTDNKTQPKKGQHLIVRGDTLVKISRQYGIPVSAIAEANNMGRNDPLYAGQTLRIPSQSEVAKLQRQAEERAKTLTAKAKAKETTKPKETTAKAKETTKPKEAKTTAKSVKPFYSVQVALADNEAKANELAKKYRQAGYKVQTSKTSRGVRVLVGAENSNENANKLKSKLANDSRVDASGAWVKYVDTINK